MEFKKQCFVIGPMNAQHIHKLAWLAEKVVADILKPEAFNVFTPDVKEAGSIMNHIITSADRSDIVIADITGNNPNVLYEIGVLHAMGKICIPVKITEPGMKEDLPPFDIAQYRFFNIPYLQTDVALQTLKPVIESELDNSAKGNIPSNPLTEFFGTTLSAMASARGQARAYFRNFIKPALDGIVKAGPSSALNRNDLMLEIIIPNKVQLATRWSVENLKKAGKIIPATLNAKGRDVFGYLWPENISFLPMLVDIPTVMGQLHDNILARMGRLMNPDHSSDLFLQLEMDEINQFERSLHGFINTEPDFERTRVRVVRVGASLCPELFEEKVKGAGVV